LTEVTFVLANGRKVSCEVDTEQPPGPAFFVLGVRKCGTTLLNNICTALAEANRVQFVDLGAAFFNGNIPASEWTRDPALGDVVMPGNVYGGFRQVPYALFDNPHFRDDPKLLIVRDPRDALVSEYFSNAYSHPIPSASSDGDAIAKLMTDQRQSARSQTIDEYVIHRAPGMVTSMLAAGDTVSLPMTKVLKYEDYIFNKADLMRTVCAHFNWAIDDQLIGLILEWADIRPETEDPLKFVRKVTPGDHREKLRSETIAQLNDRLKPAMTAFGYAPD
jgi:hypothetical protein